MPRTLIQLASRRRTTHPARCRGSVYLLVVGTSMLVTLLGLTAVMLTRVERRMDSAVLDAAQARLLAQSAVELALQQIADDPGWRHAFTHDAWTAETALGRGTVSVRLTDADDGSLSDDSNDSVILTARGRVGEAIRMCSVRLETPSPTGAMLVNPGGEGGLSPWVAYPDAGAVRLEHEDGDVHGGSGAFYARDRTGPTAGVAQDVTSHVREGVVHELRGWFFQEDSSGDGMLSLVIRSTGDASPLVFSGPAVGMGREVWTQVSATVTPTWSGELVDAHLVAHSSGSAGDIIVDDFALTPGDSAPLTPVPTTWRQVVE